MASSVHPAGIPLQLMVPTRVHLNKPENRKIGINCRSHHSQPTRPQCNTQYSIQSSGKGADPLGKVAAVPTKSTHQLARQGDPPEPGSVDNNHICGPGSARRRRLSSSRPGCGGPEHRALGEVLDSWPGSWGGFQRVSMLGQALAPWRGNFCFPAAGAIVLGPRGSWLGGHEALA